MRLSPKMILTVSALLCFHQAHAQSPVSPLWNNLKPGPYDVGFMIHNASEPESARPIRMMIWYPGKKDASSQNLRFSDYVYTEPSNVSLTAYYTILQNRDLRTIQGQFHQRSDSLTRALMKTQTAAYREISHPEDHFPLLLHSLGIGNFQQESTVLWEYLASYGYVVATVPQFGPNLNQSSPSYSSEGLDIQLKDMEYALSEITRFAFVDRQRIGVVGHSFGGLIALLMASKNENIDAVVSLDGSVNIERGRDLMRSIKWDPNGVRAPILNLYTLASGHRDLSILESLDATDRYHVAFNNASHYDFQNWPLYAILTKTTDSRGERRRSAEEGRDIYLSVIRLTHHFLDGMLKDKTSPLLYLKEGLPENLASFRFQEGIKNPH